MNAKHFERLLTERLETFKHLSETARYPEIREWADDCTDILEQVAQDFQRCSAEESESDPIETLVNYAGREDVKHIGRHMVERWNGRLPYTLCLDDKNNTWKRVKRPTRVFSYYGDTICIVNDSTKQFWLSYAGWFTPSTTHVMNQYREWFSRLGYKCMTD